MVEATSSPVQFTTTRTSLFDPPEELRQWRDEAPMHRVVYPDGHEGWLVTGHAAARAVLGDPRFTTRPELVHDPIPQREAQRGTAELPPGLFLRMDPPDHTRFRRLLAGQFTVRRMKRLEPMIEEITRDCLDAMERGDRPVDLVQAFALPIPSLVICELLGVPYGDREQFQRASSELIRLDSTPDQINAAVTDLLTYLHGLVLRKRADPADDLLGDLIAHGDLTDAELAGVTLLLLAAGHETTANMLALGTFALLRNPAQLAAVRDDPAVIDNAVEELLRYLTIVHIGPARAALEDVELDGRLIRAGESVTLALSAANRDLEQFEAPEILDVRHSATGHLAFGHGIHQCLGQQLARSEMRIAYPALLRRFPDLRLAVPADEVAMRTDMAIYGVHRLPVTW